ncbi:MAG TPA: zinc ribbon domain-containing protein, partial [Candidatus Bathyarchaeia archaeon]|nr:zinc ribbon domain-containing protein [Candidatus Bathyarchaeia archaeon]
TIIAILAIATAVIGLTFGALLITGSALLASIGLFGVGGILAGIVLVFAGIVLFFAFLWILVGWGFLNGKGWARTLGLIFSFLGVLFAIGAVAMGSYTTIVGLLIWGLIIFYLFTGPVKTFFASGPGANLSHANPTTTSRPSFSPASFAGPSVAGTSTGSWGTPRTNTSQPTTSHASSNTARFCNNCGATIGQGLTKCSSCGAPI